MEVVTRIIRAYNKGSTNVVHIRVGAHYCPFKHITIIYPTFLYSSADGVSNISRPAPNAMNLNCWEVRVLARMTTDIQRHSLDSARFKENTLSQPMDHHTAWINENRYIVPELPRGTLKSPGKPTFTRKDLLRKIYFLYNRHRPLLFYLGDFNSVARENPTKINSAL